MKATAAGQYPLASVVSCIDSRAPAEMVFDQGIGDLFNARVAGNIVNEGILGSLEFAHKAAGANLLVVMGHTRSLGGSRNVGCKLTAAVYFSPISCQISRYSAAKSSKTIPSLGPIFAQTPSAAQAPSPNCAGSASSFRANQLRAHTQKSIEALELDG